jgi:very-short-patch-repair endonuclease
MTTYLTEQSLYPLLVNAFGETKVKRQFRLSNNKRVDYVIEDADIVYPVKLGKFSSKPGNIAIEFDGYRHYQQNSTIERDFENQAILLDQGFHIIHIPYWLQAHFALPFFFCCPLADKVFGYDQKDTYPNGFIDSKCLRPSDFSLPGWRRFVYEVSCLPTPIREEVRSTMTLDENFLFDDVAELYGYHKDELYANMCWITNTLS